MPEVKSPTVRGNLPALSNLLDHGDPYPPKQIFGFLKEAWQMKLGLDIAPYLLARFRVWNTIRKEENKRKQRVVGYDKVRKEVEHEVFMTLEKSGCTWKNYLAALVGDLGERNLIGRNVAVENPVLRNGLKATGSILLGGLPTVLELLFLKRSGLDVNAITILLTSAANLHFFAAGKDLNVTRREVKTNPLYARLALVDAAKKGPEALTELAYSCYKSAFTDDQNKIADNDILKKQGRDPKTDFLTKERIVFLGEIARYPTLALKMLATFLYEEPMYKNIIIPQLKKLQFNELIDELEAITEIEKRLQSDNNIAGDPNTIGIIVALKEMGIPEMMQLFLNTLSKTQLFRFFSQTKILSTDHEMRTNAFGTIYSNPNHPLINASVSITNHYFGEGRASKKLGEENLEIYRLTKDKCVDDLTEVIPDTETPVTKGGAIASSEAAKIDAAWSAFRPLLRIFRQVPDNIKKQIIEKIKSEYKKKHSYKRGIPLPHQIMVFLRSNIGYEPAANLLYSHFVTLIRHNVGISSSSKTSFEIASAAGQILSNLQKRIDIDHANPVIAIPKEEDNFENKLFNSFVRELITSFQVANTSFTVDLEAIQSATGLISRALSTGEGIETALTSLPIGLAKIGVGSTLITFIKTNFQSVLDPNTKTVINSIEINDSAVEMTKMIMSAIVALTVRQ